MQRISIAALAALAFLAAAGLSQALDFGLETLDILTASGPHRFSIEVMRTEAEREKGLMFRKFLPAGRGMLFDFKAERQVTMWMKNTYLPLDMIFIGKDGKVVSVAQNAEPLSEAIIPSQLPAYAVLEINAGEAAAIGVKAGDKVLNGLFEK